MRIGAIHFGAALVLACSVFAHAQGTCTPPPSGIVSWWPADGYTDDIIGGNSGTLMNGATFAQGKVRQAFSFNGTSSYVQVPDSVSLDNLTNAITVELWAFIDPNAPANAGNVVHLVSKTRSVLIGGFVLFFDDRKQYGVSESIRFTVTKGDGTYGQATANMAITTPGWYHIAATYDMNAGGPDQVKLYINGGTPKGTATYNQPMGTNSNPLVFGASSQTPPINQEFFQGLLDEITIYNRALTQTEIQSIFSADSAGKCKIEIMPRLAQAVAEYDNTIQIETLPRLTQATMEYDAPSLNLYASPNPITISVASANVPVTISAAIYNRGSTDAFNVAVEIYDTTSNPLSTAPIIGSTTISSILSGSSAVASFSASFSSAGTKTITVVVNPNLPQTEVLPRLTQAVMEYDNLPQVNVFPRLTQAIIEYDLPQGLPDLLVYYNSIVSIAPVPGSVGSAATIYLNVYNIGPATANNVVVRVYDYINPSAPVSIGTSTIASIAGYSSAFTTITTANFTKDGVRILTIVADPDNTIAESNKANNSTSVFYQVGTVNFSAAILIWPQTSNPYFLRAQNLSICDQYQFTGATVPSFTGGSNATLGFHSNYCVQVNGVYDNSISVQGSLVTALLIGPSGIAPYPIGAVFTDVFGNFNVPLNVPTAPGNYVLEICVTDTTFTGCIDLPFVVFGVNGGSPPPITIIHGIGGGGGSSSSGGLITPPYIIQVGTNAPAISASMEPCYNPNLESANGPTLNFTVTDALPISNLTYSVGSNTWSTSNSTLPTSSVANVTITSSGGYSIIIFARSLSQGLPGHSVIISATDTAGNLTKTGPMNFIVDTTAPLAGIVNDGYGADIDTQTSTTVIAANWSGFSDTDESSIGYKWAIGTAQYGTDIMNFTNSGIDFANNVATMTGLNLTVGTRYYSTVMAIGCGGNTYVSSNGVTIIKSGGGGGDTTPPVISATVAQCFNSNVDTAVGPMFRLTVTDDTKVATLSYSIDIGSMIYYASPLIYVNNSTYNYSAPINIYFNGPRLADGAHSIKITATDIYVNSSESNIGFIIDTTPPSPGIVNDGYRADIATQTSTTVIAANWSGFSDPESTISYEWAIGTAQYATNIQNFTSVGLNTLATNSSLTLSVGTTYYATVKAMSCGGTIYVSSNGVKIIPIPPPGQPPPPGTETTPPVISATVAPCFNPNVDTAVGPMFRLAVTDDTKVATVTYSIYNGSPAAIIGSALYVYTTPLLSVSSYSYSAPINTYFNGPRLADGSYTIRVTAADIYVNSSQSNIGFIIDTTAPIAGIVNDGYGADIATQTSTTTIAANWSGFSDPESAISYKLAIGTTPYGNNILSFTSAGIIGTTATYVMPAGSFLTVGQTYYATVMAISCGGTTYVSSNGVTIIPPPPPGQPGPETIPPVINATIEPCYNPNVNSAAGPRMSFTVTDDTGVGSIVYRVDSGSWISVSVVSGGSYSVIVSASGLALGSHIVTIRAIDTSPNYNTSYQSVSFVIDTTPPVAGVVNDGPGPGDIATQTSTTTIAANWSGFSDPESGVLGISYRWAIGTMPGGQDVLSFTSQGISGTTATYVTPLGSFLTVGTTYYATVIATGCGGSTAVSSNGVKIVELVSVDLFVHSEDIHFFRATGAEINFAAGDIISIGESIMIYATIHSSTPTLVTNVPVSVVDCYPTITPCVLIYSGTIPVFSGTSYTISFPYINFAQGVHIIEVSLTSGANPDTLSPTTGMYDPATTNFHDANLLNNAATRALIVGELNNLLGCAIEFPFANVKVVAGGTLPVWMRITDKFGNVVMPSGLRSIALEIYDDSSGSFGRSLASYTFNNAAIAGIFNYTANRYFTNITIPADAPSKIAIGLFVQSMGVPNCNGSVSPLIVTTSSLSTTPPTVINVDPQNGIFGIGTVIDIRVTFSEVVNVYTTGGIPTLTLATTPNNAVVNYFTGSGTDTLVFRYTVAAGQNSPHLDCVSTTSLSSNGGVIQDASGNNAILTLPSPGAPHSLGANTNIIIDTTPPFCIGGLPGMVSWWPFNEGGGTIAADVVDGNKGTLVNNPTWTAGKVGDALSFNGVNQYVLVPNNSNLSLTDFTIEAWIKVIGRTSNWMWQAIVSKSISNSGATALRNYGLYVAQSTVLGGINGTVQLFLGTGSTETYTATNTYGAQGTTNVIDGMWHHVAATYDHSAPAGTGTRIFIDGREETTPTIFPLGGGGIVPSQGNMPLSIGIDTPTTLSFFPFNGNIDEVHIFNTALSPAEIKAIFNAGSAGISSVGNCVNDGLGADIDFQSSITTISTNWHGFSDALSGVASYSVGVLTGGTGVGATYLVPLTNYANTAASATFTGLGLTNGTTYYIAISATDAAGNTSALVYSNGVTVDTMPPIISNVVITPNCLNTTSGTILFLTFSATDAISGVGSIFYFIDGGLSGAVPIPVSPSRIYSVPVFGTSLLSEGIHTITIVATDNVGNPASVSATFVIDNTPPNIVTPYSVTTIPASPINAVTSTSSSIHVSATAYESEMFSCNVIAAEFYIGSSAPPLGMGFPMSVTGIGSSVTMPSTLAAAFTYTSLASVGLMLPDGVYTIYVRAKDDAGNWSAGKAIGTFILHLQPLVVTPMGFNPAQVNTTYSSGIDDANYLFSLSEPAIIAVGIYNIVTGAVVYSSTGVMMSAGAKSYSWNGTSAGLPLPAGVFAYFLTGQDLVGTPISPAIYSNSTMVNSPTVQIFINKPSIGGLSAPLSIDPSMGGTATISYTLYNSPGVRNFNVTVDIINSGGSIIRTIASTVTGVTSTGTPASTVWNGRDSGGVIVPDGSYNIRVSASRITPPGPPGSANPKTTAITVTSTRFVKSQDNVVNIFYSPDAENVTINQNPIVPIATLNSLYGLSVHGSNLVSNIYGIKQDLNLSLTASLIFNHNKNLEGNALKIVRFNNVNGRWESLQPELVDPTNKRVIVNASGFSSLYAVISNKDITPPEITGLTITPAKITFAISDGESGVDVSTTRILFDGQDVTSRATFSGVNGDANVAVGLTISYDLTTPHTIEIVASDMAGNQSTRQETFKGGFIQATITIDPQSLNVNSGVMTVYVQFPQGYDVSRIDTAFLDGASPLSFQFAPAGAGGFTGPTMIIKYNRQDVENALARTGQTLSTTFTLTGTFFDFNINSDSSFEGVGTITKIIQK